MPPSHHDIAERFFDAPHPDVHEDLLFFPQPKHTEVFNKFAAVSQAEANEIMQREDLFVGYIVFLVLPWYVKSKITFEVAYATQDAVKSSQRDEALS